MSPYRAAASRPEPPHMPWWKRFLWSFVMRARFIGGRWVQCPEHGWGYCLDGALTRYGGRECTCLDHDCNHERTP